MTSVEVVSRGPEDTQGVGRILGALSRPGDVILMTGELGAGKTCLTQGILWGLDGDEYARSPTFVLVSEYHARLTMYHIDLYRLDTSAEVVDLGLDEYLSGNGVCAVEWAEKAPELFAWDHLAIEIRHRRGERRGARTVVLTAAGDRYDSALRAVQAAQRSGLRAGATWSSP